MTSERSTECGALVRPSMTAAASQHQIRKTPAAARALVLSHPFVRLAPEGSACSFTHHELTHARLLGRLAPGMAVPNIRPPYVPRAHRAHDLTVCRSLRADAAWRDRECPGPCSRGGHAAPDMAVAWAVFPDRERLVLAGAYSGGRPEGGLTLSFSSDAIEVRRWSGIQRRRAQRARRRPRPAPSRFELGAARERLSRCVLLHDEHRGWHTASRPCRS